jgi:transcriptional regulator GlxA family with amidase domain
MGTTIGVALFDGAEELDWAGPWEVLAAWAQQFPDDGVRVLTLAQEAGTVTCAKGLRVIPDETWASAPPLDVLVYPGGSGTRAQLGDEAIRGWLRGIAASGALVTSVCTGALVLADAGLLDGRPATTWWGRLDELATLGRDIEVRPEARFVDSGDIVTAAGVSAGIDMALTLAEKIAGRHVAEAIQLGIEYDPQPPFDAGAPEKAPEQIVAALRARSRFLVTG